MFFYLLGAVVLGWAWAGIICSLRFCRFWLLSLRQLIFQENISRSWYVLYSEHFICLVPTEFSSIWDHSALLQMRPQNVNSDAQKLGAWNLWPPARSVASLTYPSSQKNYVAKEGLNPFLRQSSAALTKSSWFFTWSCTVIYCTSSICWNKCGKTPVDNSLLHYVVLTQLQSSFTLKNKCGRDPMERKVCNYILCICICKGGEGENNTPHYVVLILQPSPHLKQILCVQLSSF